MQHCTSVHHWHHHLKERKSIIYRLLLQKLWTELKPLKTGRVLKGVYNHTPLQTPSPTSGLMHSFVAWNLMSQEILYHSHSQAICTSLTSFNAHIECRYGLVVHVPCGNKMFYGSAQLTWLGFWMCGMNSSVYCNMHVYLHSHRYTELWNLYMENIIHVLQYMYTCTLYSCINHNLITTITVPNHSHTYW